MSRGMLKYPLEKHTMAENRLGRGTGLHEPVPAYGISFQTVRRCELTGAQQDVLWWPLLPGAWPGQGHAYPRGSGTAGLASYGVLPL